MSAADLLRMRTLSAELEPIPPLCMLPHKLKASVERGTVLGDAALLSLGHPDTPPHQLRAAAFILSQDDPTAIGAFLDRIEQRLSAALRGTR